MGFAELFTRSTKYTALDTISGETATWFVKDNISPDWSSAEYQGAMAIPGAWRASILLSDLLAGLPWKAYRTYGDANDEEIEPCPAFLEQPNPPEPRVTTLSSMALDLLWHGNAVALIASRDRNGWPTAYLPVPAEFVKVRRVEAWELIPLPEGTILYEIGSNQYSQDDVIHVKGPCRPGFLRGMGVLETHLSTTLTLAAEQGRQARSLGSSGIPTGVLNVADTEDEPLDESEANKIKQGWLRSQRDRTVAVLNSRTSFEALSWNPTETQLLDARKFSLQEIALIFGLDPSWLGVSGHTMRYSNIESDAINLVKFSLSGHLARFEQTLSLQMPRGTVARADLDELLRADTLTRYQAHAIAITSGFMTPNEVRAQEHLPPLTPEQLAQLTAAAPPTAPGSSSSTTTDPLTGAPDGVAGLDPGSLGIDGGTGEDAYNVGRSKNKNH